jgi:hypothetical protein
MNDEKLIWENYQNIILENSKIDILYYSEDSDEYDPWVIADKVEMVFKKAGIRPSRDKDIRFFAMLNDEVIGATYNQESERNAEEFGGPDEDILVYTFDIAVDPKHQGGTVGYLLTKACVDDAKSIDSDKKTVMYNNVINVKMAQMLEKFFGFEFISEENPEGSYYATMIKYL